MRYQAFEYLNSRIAQVRQELHELEAQKTTLDMCRFYCGTFFDRSKVRNVTADAKLDCVTPRAECDADE